MLIYGINAVGEALRAGRVVSLRAGKRTDRRLLELIAQAQQSHVPSTGVILNDLDWKKMEAEKDGQNRYLGGGPFGTIGNNIWTLPVVDPSAMPEGHFMVGASP